MDSSQIKTAYKTFFEQSDAGEYFMNSLDNLIDSKHKEAEKNPELARDHTQRACGVRDVQNMIKVMTADIKTNHLSKGVDSES